mmetsp:Transcript_26540/g.69733  ORF Transcript_26540/g.69733 Transcript_26540/m.69733 type:complete len:91 (-) Transcript_26540:131-403(-)
MCSLLDQHQELARIPNAKTNVNVNTPSQRARPRKKANRQITYGERMELPRPSTQHSIRQRASSHPDAFCRISHPVGNSEAIELMFFASFR